jgi:Ca-activated chloride channel family protein
MNDHTDTPMPDDALLTAYALGELDPQSDDYQAIAARVAEDPELQAQVESIRQLADRLQQSYEHASGPGLDTDALMQLGEATQCGEALDAHAPLARIQPKRPLTRRLLPYAGVAACTALATAGVFIALQQDPFNNVASTNIDLQGGTAMEYEPSVYPMESTSPENDAPHWQLAPAPTSTPSSPHTPALATADPLGLSKQNDKSRYAFGHSDSVNLGVSLYDERLQPGYAGQGRLGAKREAALADGRVADRFISDLAPSEPGRPEDRALNYLERERKRAEHSDVQSNEARKAEEVKSYLRAARRHQLDGDYDESLKQLDAALFLDPENAVVKAYREMVRDTQTAVADHRLHRNRDLEIDPAIERQAIELANAIEARIIEVERREELRMMERERRERFGEINDNPFKLAEHEPLSTFSVDVDTASYAFGRRAILTEKTLPPPDAVRIEEWINYFDYAYTAPVVDPEALPNGRLTTASLKKLEAADESFVPFSTEVEVAQCPWNANNQLVRIGIQAMDVDRSDRPPAHLVFLLDVSGSMNSPDKLGLVQRGMPMLLDQLNENDKVSIVVYAGATGLILEAAEAADQNKIKEAIARLRAGGSTAGGAGIELAYSIAEKHFIEGGINRVILCTDGDFNVGTSDTRSLVKLVEEKANPKADPNHEDAENKGVYLSVMGFGRGNLNDEMMEKITNAGNGNYHYIDSVNEAVKTMSSQAGGTLVTVAKDVKLQLEFNPARVASYRLIGYENRVLRNEDFNDDTVDAGDIGAGHSVTALYEIVPMLQAEGEGAADAELAIDDLRYQKPRGLADAANLPELLTLKLRYKPVDAKAEEGTSRKIVKHVPAKAVAFDKASETTRFASSVAAMGMILRGSPHKGEATTRWVVETAQAASEHDPNGYRDEFIRLATQAGLLEMEREDAFRPGFVE